MDKIMACTSHNYLIKSPFDTKLVYFIDSSFNIMSLSIQNEIHLPDPYPVANMRPTKMQKPIVAPTLTFFPNNKNFAISSNGLKSIFVWKVASNLQKWELLFSKEIEDGLSDSL